VAHLPVIVGFGGVSPAGRSSFHHGYRRLVIDRLAAGAAAETYQDLAVMMGLIRTENGRLLDPDGRVVQVDHIGKRFGPAILRRTLLRKIMPGLFDVDHVRVNKPLQLSVIDRHGVQFDIARKDLPVPLPADWELISDGDESVRIAVRGHMPVLWPETKTMAVQTAGQMPEGFDPGAGYNSRHHPRGLKMAVWGASDAIASIGIDWETIQQAVRPDQIGVYAGSGHGQMDDTGGGGLMKAHVLGRRTTSRYLPLSLLDMPSNFINAYIIGNVGHTGTQKGACATFLFNLELALKEIRSGRRRVCIVGNSEAPLIPEIIDGYRAMSALADDARLSALFGSAVLEHEHRAASCRPFGDNCGFTLAESSQYVVLFDDALAVALGAQIHGAIGDIFIKADGFKKSISSPGFGNYITLAKSAALARSILGEKALRQRTFISAHGSGTPLNRTTESHALSEIARVFGIDQWPVSAVKCYYGHPLTPAAGDQLMAILGTWEYGLIPGIFTLDQVAEDVCTRHLRFSQSHIEVGVDTLDAAFINSKGFGGNNATGLVLSPQLTLRMMTKKHGRAVVAAYRHKSEAVAEKARDYDRQAMRGLCRPVYRDSEKLLSEADLDLTSKRMVIPGFDHPIDLELETPYPDMRLED
jgi:acetoacetyl-[acyl-carrier protein] synthase